MAVRQPEPYALADKAIAALNRLAIKRFNSVTNALLITGFDELTIIQQTRLLYKRLDADNRKWLVSLFVEHYTEIYDYAVSENAEKKSVNADDKSANANGKSANTDRKSVKTSDKTAVQKAAEQYVSKLLSEPNPVTGYSYDNEVTRKRDRCEEAVVSASGKSAKQAEMKKALRLWTQMTQQYADAVSDGANLQALTAAGVQYVKWITQKDERVCNTCKERNGKIYRIERVPDKPHWRCRCYLLKL